jgi:hypothetical protein
MSWNYRVVKSVTKIPLGDMDTSYCIHTVFTDDNGTIVNISEKPSYAIGDDIESLKWNLESMMLSVDKPIIDYNTGEELNQQSHLS